MQLFSIPHIQPKVKHRCGGTDAEGAETPGPGRITEVPVPVYHRCLQKSRAMAGLGRGHAA